MAGITFNSSYLIQIQKISHSMLHLRLQWRFSFSVVINIDIDPYRQAEGRQALKVSFLLYIVWNLKQKCRNDASSWPRKCKVCDNIIAWKGSKYKVFSGPHFPVFGLNMDIYRVNLCIESEYRKIRTRKNSVYGHFSCSVYNQKKSIAQHEKRHDQAFK